MSDLPTVALVGTGRMGAAMAARMSAAGIALVLYNRTPERARAVAADCRAAVAGTAREAASAADVVLVSLADDRAVLAAYRGPDGLAAGLRPGTVVADTSTVDPATVGALQSLVADRGAELLDTPVSGNPSVVRSGNITVMAGGDAAALERARPALESFARRIFHLGGHGTGAAMKLVVNSALHGLNQALAESLVLAEKAGIPRTAAYEVFVDSAVAAPFVKYKREAYEHPDTTPVAFSLDLAAKDLDLILALAARVGARVPQATANRDIVAAATAGGYGDHDLAALATYLAGSGQE